MKIDKTQPDEILGDEDVAYPAYKNQNSKSTRFLAS